MNKKILLIIFFASIICASLFLGAFYYYRVQEKSNKLSGKTEENNLSLRAQDKKQESLDNEGRIKVVHPEYGFMITYPSKKINHTYDEKSKRYIFCESGGSESISEFDMKKANELGCLTSLVLNNSKGWSLEEWIEYRNSNIGPSGYKFHSKEVLKLGTNEFYKVNYRDESVGGYYLYLILSSDDNLIQFAYNYEDYSIENDRVIPLYEEMIGTFEE